MKIKDLKKFEDDKYILLDGGGEVYSFKVDHVSDVAVWLKIDEDMG